MDLGEQEGTESPAPGCCCGLIWVRHGHLIRVSFIFMWSHRLSTKGSRFIGKLDSWKTKKSKKACICPCGASFEFQSLAWMVAPPSHT